MHTALPVCGALLCAAFCAPGDLPAQLKLTTVPTANVSTTIGASLLFDLAVMPAGGVWITALETNSQAGAHAPLSVDVYTTVGTYVGKEATASAWTKVASGHANAGGTNVHVAVTFPTYFHLPAGTHGFYVHYVNVTPYYVLGNGSNQVHSTAELTLTAGQMRSTLFGGGGVSPRVWSGSILYDVTPSPPSFVNYGSKCAGSNGSPALSAQTGSRPRIGTSFVFSMANLPTLPAPLTVMLGVSRTSYQSLALPFDLTPINMLGCRLYAAADLTVAGANIGGTGIASLAIPGSTTLLGQAVYTQAFVVDLQGNPFGATLTDAAQLLIGL